VSDAQKIGYFLEKKEFPFLHNFEEQCKKFEDVNYKKLNKSKFSNIWWYMQAHILNIMSILQLIADLFFMEKIWQNQWGDFHQ